MQIFEHLANDELLLLLEENRNKIVAFSAKSRHSRVVDGSAVRRVLDLESETALITKELRERNVPARKWIN